MKTIYKHDLNDAYFLVEVPQFYVEDYQIPMLRANHIEGVLPVSARGIDEFSQFSYDISGMISMRAMYGKSKIERKDMELFVSQLVRVIKGLKNHMLNADKLMLKPEHIFFQKEQFYFCYLPTQDVPLCRAFHELTEYFVSQVNYEEKEGIHLAYELHKATMEEHYDIEQILEEYHKLEKQEVKKSTAQERGNVFVLEEDAEDGEEIPTIQEMGGTWGNIRHVLRKKKKDRWGMWEGLVTQESFTNE